MRNRVNENALSPVRTYGTFIFLPGNAFGFGSCRGLSGFCSVTFRSAFCHIAASDDLPFIFKRPKALSCCQVSKCHSKAFIWLDWRPYEVKWRWWTILYDVRTNSIHKESCGMPVDLQALILPPTDEKLLSPPSSKSTPSHRLSGVSFPAVTPPLQGVNPGKLEQRLFCECFLWPSFNHRCCNSHVKFCCVAKCLRQL